MYFLKYPTFNNVKSTKKLVNDLRRALFFTPKNQEKEEILFKNNNKKNEKIKSND